MADVGSRFAFWYLPKGVVTFTPPVLTLTLADYNVRAGQDYLVLALVESGADGEEKYTAGSVGTLLDGELDLNAVTVISRIRVRDSGARITVNRTGTLSLASLFGAGDAFENPNLEIQTLDGLVTSTNLLNSGGQFANFDGLLPLAIANDIADGDRFIIAIYSPIPQDSLLKWGTDDLLWNTDQLTWN